MMKIFLAYTLALGLAGATPSNNETKFLERLIKAAQNRTRHTVVYNGAYRKIKYPGGDVPPNIGVCTDVVIRSYRRLGIDLQKEVHEDMRANFRLYPRNWGLRRPDTNIDHRRVPNLMTFFARKGKSLPISNNPKDYSPGDLVTWDLGGNVPHIGILVPAKGGSAPWVVHNIGAGPKLENVLFDWKITGHYRYFGP